MAAFISKVTFTVTALGLLTLSLSACAPVYPAGAYPAACSQNTVSGAVLGAVAGAAIGDTSRRRNGAIDAASGAIIGGTSGAIIGNATSCNGYANGGGYNQGYGANYGGGYGGSTIVLETNRTYMPAPRPYYRPGPGFGPHYGHGPRW